MKCGNWCFGYQAYNLPAKVAPNEGLALGKQAWIFARKGIYSTGVVTREDVEVEALV